MLRTLHASERPLRASEVARATGLHRGTAYNILRTLYAEGFVGYDEATRSYAVSLHILELAYGVLRRSGLMDLARPLMDAVSDAHGVSVYLSRCWPVVAAAAGLGRRRVPHRSLRHRRAAVPWPGRGLGGDHGRFRQRHRGRTGSAVLRVAWYRKPSFGDFLAVRGRTVGFAVDCGTMFQGITQVSVPVLSPSWELLLVLTAAGHAHDIDSDAVGLLSRAMQSRRAFRKRALRLG